ncbi:MAG TPA: thioredoxin domain-containing protein [Gemmatimonadaceae bacterium]|nr:thioredoxin domain-containing protein [Gemmatimonadaceae bacterium]
MANRLANETSPYLLQHAENPVDWYPWGPEALDRARLEDKPILLSIGYAACHWCHVMAHESFEDEKVAALMNANFINIKVDREERPDIDAIYMQAVQALTGHGGWPMTVFLTPFGEPFYGGTYYPPQERQGMPSFSRVLTSVADAYRNRPESVTQTARKVSELYEAAKLQARSEGALTPHVLDLAYRGIAQKYDVRHGGFDGAPKFPQTMSLDFCLRYWARTGTAYALEMVVDSFRKMMRGGIYDQVGGGFHRYTVDAIWLVPHFEKMLYDNALLVRIGAHLWQATGDAEFRRVTEETIEWLAKEMTSPDSGFYSSLDADSEGEEGKFYVWSDKELDALLGKDAAAVKAYFGVTAGGNFEGRNIFHLRTDPSFAAARMGVSRETLHRIIANAKAILYAERNKRVRPGRDDKILAGWNGLMLRGLATAARIFERDDFAKLAVANGEFLFRELVRDGRVMRSFNNGTARIGGFLEDYAAVALGFLSLYELTLEAVWVERARQLAHSMVEWFWDEQLGAFFDTAGDAESLITRPRDVTDNALPSGTSLAVDLLLSLSELTHDVDMRRRATFVLESIATPLMRYPSAFGHMLGAADMAINGAVEVAIAGSPGEKTFESLKHEVAVHYVPSLVIAGGHDDGAIIALMEGRESRSGRATAYVCRSYACEEPATTPSVLASQLEKAGRIQQQATT